jgi:hypothetical protein
VQRLENDVVRVVFPVKAAAEIAAEKAGGSGGHGEKVVTLNNGRTIKVPEHSKVGSKVWIRLHDEQYMSRVRASSMLSLCDVSLLHAAAGCGGRG